MRYLGIDYGSKRVGVAISDEGGTMAFPYAILENTRTLVGEIKNICAKEQVESIVLGESLDYQGNPNAVMEKMNQFMTELREQVGTPIFQEREFLSTQQARFFQTEKKHVDDSAAAIILQSYLDRKNIKPLMDSFT